MFLCIYIYSIGHINMNETLTLSSKSCCLMKKVNICAKHHSVTFLVLKEV